MNLRISVSRTFNYNNLGCIYWMDTI